MKNLRGKLGFWFAKSTARVLTLVPSAKKKEKPPTLRKCCHIGQQVLRPEVFLALCGTSYCFLSLKATPKAAIATDQTVKPQRKIMVHERYLSEGSRIVTITRESSWLITEKSTL